MKITAFVKQHALLLFVLSTVVLTFATVLLPLPQEVLPLLMVFIPSVVALILVATTEGQPAVRSLLASLRKPVNLKWIAIALGAGLVLRLGVSLLALLVGQVSNVQIGAFSPLIIMVFVFAAGEELGWRGYALPRLLKNHSRLSACFILGIPWAFLHLALLLPGMMNEGVPALSQIFIMVALSVLTSWVYLGAGNSVLAATLLHGGQNAFAILIHNVGLDPALSAWLMAVVYIAIAVIVVLVNAPTWLSYRVPQEKVLNAVKSH
jgi:membrane protease YdiL (CAAX protease family)